MGEISRTQTFLSSNRTLWIVASLTILLFAIANLPWRLDDYDQAKQAFTSFQMIKEGRWFYQQTPHQRVATKPPLAGWTSAGLFAITRSWDMAWRLPSFLSAVAIAIVLFRAASSAYGTVAGLLAVGAFGLNLLSPRLATLVRTDMPLALAIFLIGLLILEKIRTAMPWTQRDRIYLLAFLTAAMLIKGPIVYAFLLPGIALFEWWRSRAARSQGAMSPCSASRGERLDAAGRLQSACPGWWPWIASLAIFLLWVIGGVAFQPGFFEQVVVREFAARFAETVHRPQPLYFYFPHLLHKFFPWSVFMMAIAIVDLRSRNWRLRSVFREMSPETFWLICWSVGGLIAMSLIPSKRVDRIFPVVPPLCLVLAAQIAKRNSCSHGSVSRPSESVDSNSTGHRPVATEKPATRIYRWSAIALTLAILVAGGYTISKVITGYLDHRDALAVFGRKVRHEAELHHWRYEVVSARDEALLLYLRKTRFIEANHAVAEWNRGDLDALVASTDKATGLMPELQGAVLSGLKSTEPNAEQGKAYVLITH